MALRVCAYLLLAWISCSCAVQPKACFPKPSGQGPGGREFYRQAAAMGWAERDSFAEREILRGNMPGFWRKFQRIEVRMTDSLSGKPMRAAYFVAPDYLSVGNRHDWARVPLTPMAAQRIADSLHCFLPTRKLVDDIYAHAKVKLEPVPMYAYRDSTPTMWHHHLIIEGQRQGRKGLIAGIKKDVVLSGKISRDARSNRVAIYGWHKPDGKPIQPLYSGHVNWYVDYSHGIRLVWRQIRVRPPGATRSRWMDYTAVLQDAALRPLLCDEPHCDFFKY